MSLFESCPEDVALHILWTLGVQKVGLMSMFTLISTNKAMRLAWTPLLRTILPFCPDALLRTARLLVDGERRVFDAAICEISPNEWGSYNEDCPNCERWDDLMDVMQYEIFPIFTTIAAFHDNTEVVECMIEGNFSLGFEHDVNLHLRCASKGYLRRTILRGDLDSALKACGKDWYPFDLFGEASNFKFVYERPHATPSLPFQRAPPNFVDVHEHDIIRWLFRMADKLHDFPVSRSMWTCCDHLEWAVRAVPKDARYWTANRLLEVATKLIDLEFWVDWRHARRPIWGC